jgi:hypothetical protein
MSYLLLTYDVTINYDIPITITPNWWLWHNLLQMLKFSPKKIQITFCKKIEECFKIFENGIFKIN